MNRLFNIGIFLLLVVPTFGQTGQELAIQQALMARTNQEVEEFKGKYKFVQQHWDQLNDGIVQTNWQLESRNRHQMIGLLTLSRGSIIFYSEVYDWDIKSDWSGDEGDAFMYTTLGINTDSSSAAQKVNELIRLPFRSTFGYACGAGAGMPLEGQRMLELLESRNIKELENWLGSINPIRQGYAYLAFSRLKSTGTELNPEIKQAMKKIEESPLVVFSCSGCTFWEPARLSELLKSENVNHFVTRDGE